MIHILSENWKTFLTGFENTILCSVIALFFSLIIGSIFAILQTVPSKLVRTIANIYIEIFRNIPLLVITMVFYVVVPQFFIKLSGFTAGTIGLTLYTSAFISETVRAGIKAVGVGQMEGARSSGLTYVQAMWHIIMPQALQKMIPPLVSQFISLVKDTSLATIIVLPELLYHAQIIYSQNTTYMVPMYLMIAVMYFVVCYCLSLVARRLEKRYG